VVDVGCEEEDADKGDGDANWPSISKVGTEGSRGPDVARGLVLLDLKLRLPPTPGGIRNDMLEGVDIRLEGELLFLARGELILTIETGLDRLLP
jgi:hypothetical protein